MKTSVVIATFNGSCYIEAQIRSILCQSIPPDEIIVADDGSTDDTISRVLPLLQTAPCRTSLTRRPRTLGYAANFSDAAMRSSNDIVLFCDQDDYWEPHKIEYILKWFANNRDKLLVTHNVSICDENLTAHIPDYFHYLDKNHLRHTFVKGCATAARRELIQAAFPLPHQLGWHHDTRIHAIARLLDRFGYIKTPLLRYRIHPSQTSGYVLQPRSALGRMLTKLDEVALNGSSPWYRALQITPPPYTVAKLRELLTVAGKSGSRNQMLHEALRIRHKSAVGRRLAGCGRAPRMAWSSRLYFRGGYRDIGGFPGFLADFIRLLKPS